MNDENDGYEAITYKRVRRRLSIVIDAMPKTATEIYSDKS
jgi:hypothetical protein